jgi:hypothetical protein
MFHRTEGDIKRARHFLSGISVGRLGWVAGVEGGAGVAGLIHIKSTVFFLFLTFLLSYFHLFFCSSCLLGLFHPIILSSYHLIILSYLYICIFHISYSHIFKKCSAHEQYVFRQEDVS